MYYRITKPLERDDYGTTYQEGTLLRREGDVLIGVDDPSIRLHYSIVIDPVGAEYFEEVEP